MLPNPKEQEENLDPRVKRTRKLILESFESLLTEKGFESISVQDVTGKAQVNRATFYAHFPDKYALLDYSISRMFMQMIDKRTLNIDEYFLKIASVVAERSTCRRHHVGAVAVKDKHILASGYNGAAAGLKDCLELGCLRNELGIESRTRHEICRGIPAEQNVIIQASLHGVGLEGATIYVTHSPCILCAKMLVNARIKRFVTCGSYADASFMDLFREAGIEFELHKKPPSEITRLP